MSGHITLLLRPRFRSTDPAPSPTLTIDQGATASVPASDTLQLTATVSDGATPTWASSDALIVTVDATGLVTWVAEGSATVTATHPTEPAVSDSIAITAEAAAPVTVTIDQGASETVAANSTLQLTATVSDGATPTWASSDELVVTVDAAGLVTWVSEGSATVTANHPTEAASDSIAITAGAVGSAAITDSYIEVIDDTRAAIVGFQVNNKTDTQSVKIEKYVNDVLVETQDHDLVEDITRWQHAGIHHEAEWGDTVRFDLTPYSGANLTGTAGTLVSESGVIPAAPVGITYHPGDGVDPTTIAYPLVALDRSAPDMTGAVTITYSPTGLMGDGVTAADYDLIQDALNAVATASESTPVYFRTANATDLVKNNTFLPGNTDDCFWKIWLPEDDSHLPAIGTDTRFVPATHDASDVNTPWFKQNAAGSICTLTVTNSVRKWRIRGIGFGVDAATPSSSITGIVRMDGAGIDKTFTAGELTAEATGNLIRRNDGGSFITDGYEVGQTLTTYFATSSSWSHPANKFPKRITAVTADTITTNLNDDHWVDDTSSGSIRLIAYSYDLKPKDVHFEHCWIKGRPAPNNVTHGIWLIGERVGIYNSYVEEIDRTQGSGQSQAIYGTELKQFAIYNNFAESPGENIMLHQTSGPFGDICRDGVVAKNHCYKRETWRPGSGAWDGVDRQVCNAFESKAGIRIHIHSNVWDGMWPSEQNAILNIKLGEEHTPYFSDSCDLIFENNAVDRLYAHAFSLSGWYFVAADASNNESVFTVRRLMIRNHLMVFEEGGWDAAELISHLIGRFYWLNNTFVLKTGSLRNLAALSTTEAYLNASILNNVYASSTNGFKAAGTTEGNLSLAFNTIDLRGNVLIGRTASLYNNYPRSTEASPVTGGNSFPAAGMWVDYAGGNYRLDPTHWFTSTNGADPGCDIDELEAATAGVV